MTLEDWIYEAAPHISGMTCFKVSNGWQVSIRRERSEGWLITVREDLETAIMDALLTVAAPKKPEAQELAGLLE